VPETCQHWPSKPTPVPSAILAEEIAEAQICPKCGELLSIRLRGPNDGPRRPQEAPGLEDTPVTHENQLTFENATA
jgi:hypothetical protein